MADIGKFIFTDEGKRMIIAQDGGIHFAVMGVVLLNNDTLTEDIVKSLTWEQLKDGEYGTLAMKGVNYLCNGSNILPEDDLAYNSAINDIFARTSKTENTYLFDCRYHPDMGVKDKDGLCYGMYDFNFNKTMLMWTGSDPSFNAIIVLGKQYVTDKDAPYSVADSQKPTVVGAIISVPDEETEETRPLVEFMAEQNEYVEFKFQWRITFTENPVIGSNVGLEAEELKDINEKFQLTNNGLKTDGETNIYATVDDVVINEFNLNENGNFAISKSIMVADQSPSDEMDFKFNSPSLLNTINCGKKDDARYDRPTYKDHRTLYSFAYEGDIANIGETPITGATMIETLRSTEPMTNTHPVYAPAPLSIPYNSYEKFPVYETRVINANVSLFGVNEFIHTTASRAIFSDNNIRMLVPNDYTANYIFSNSNFEYYSPYNNTYIKADGNTAYNGANNNSLFKSNLNLLHDGANNNILIGSDKNELFYSTNNLLLLMSNENSGSWSIASATYIQSNRNNVEDSCTQLMLLNSNDCSIHDGGGYNSLIMNSKSAELYNNATNVTMIDTVDCKMYNLASSAILIGEKNSEIYNTSLYTYLIAGSANIVRDGCSGTSIFASHSNYLATNKDVTIINGYDNGYNDAGRTSYHCYNLQDSVILNSRNTDKFNANEPSIYSNKVVINAIGIKGNAVSVKGGGYTGHEVYLGQYNNKLSPYNEDSLVPLIIGGGINDTYRYNALTFELVKSFNFNGTDYTDKNSYEYKGLLKTDAIYANIGISANKAKFNDGLTANSITTDNISVQNATDFTIGGTTITNYIDNEIEQKAKPATRTFFAEVFVSDTNNTNIGYTTPKIGAWYDTGTTDKSKSPMYLVLENWIKYGLFGYQDDNDGHPDADSHYYFNGAMRMASQICPNPKTPSPTGVPYVLFGFANNDETNDYKYPYMYAVLPEGYDFVELNVHFVDVDSEDYIFPLIPLVNSIEQQTRVRINLISCDMEADNQSSEHLHFWMFKRYIPHSNTNVETVLKQEFNDMFELRDEVRGSNCNYRMAQITIDDGCGVCLECMAMPAQNDANATKYVDPNIRRPISIGWKLLNNYSISYDDND